MTTAMKSSHAKTARSASALSALIYPARRLHSTTRELIEPRQSYVPVYGGVYITHMRLRKKPTACSES